MDVLHPRCCGLDVHKSSISACILLREAGRVQKHQRRFGAMSQELQELAEWLRQFRVTQVAMESSGVYWKPVWNILEKQFAVVLANAQHIKNVPGRKTDQKDAEWIAQLLQYGLLRARCVLGGIKATCVKRLNLTIVRFKSDAVPPVTVLP